MTDQPSQTAPAPFTADDYAARRQRAAQAGQEAGLAGLLVTPGPDLIYFTGYEPVAITERITMLVIPVDGEPAMIVPKLERPDAENAAGASPSAWWTGRTAATRTRPRRSCWPRPAAMPCRTRPGRCTCSVCRASCRVRPTSR